MVGTPDVRTEREKRMALSPPMDQTNPKTGKTGNKARDDSAKAEKATKAPGSKMGNVTFTFKGNTAP